MVNCERVGVQHDGQVCYSGPDARQVAPEVWRTLDQALQPAAGQGEAGAGAGPGLGSSWLDGTTYPHCARSSFVDSVCCWHGVSSCLPAHLPTRPPVYIAGGSRQRLADATAAAAEEAQLLSCCVGEVVGLDVELSNPLQLDLEVTHLRLTCSWEPGPAGSSSSSSASPDRSAAAAAAAPAAGDAGTACSVGDAQQLPLQVPLEFQVGAW